MLVPLQMKGKGNCQRDDGLLKNITDLIRFLEYQKCQYDGEGGAIMEDTEDIAELDIKHVVQVLLAKIKFIVVAVLAFGVIAFSVTYFLVTPLYLSSISLYVSNAKIMQQTRIDSNDIDASTKLVNTYMAIVQSDAILNKVATIAHLDYTASDIRKMMSMEAVANTEIFTVGIENPNPKRAAKLANTLAKVTFTELVNYLEGSSVKVIDYATIADKPSSPNMKLNTLIGVLLGLMVSIAFVVLQDMLDVRIKTEEDLEHLFSLPILCAIPDMNEVNNKSSYSYTNRRN